MVCIGLLLIDNEVFVLRAATPKDRLLFVGSIFVVSRFPQYLFKAMFANVVTIMLRIDTDLYGKILELPSLLSGIAAVNRVIVTILMMRFLC